MEKLLFEMRALEGEELKISGIVNNYTWSKSLKGINGKFIEQIPKQVWEDALKENEDIKLYVNHEDFVNVAKDMKVTPTDEGVLLEATLIPEARNLYEKIKEGIVHSFSFGFRALQDKWEQGGTIAQRTIEKMKLSEISLLSVTPAYSHDAMLQTRSVEVPNAYLHDLDIKKKQLELLKLK